MARKILKVKKFLLVIFPPSRSHIILVTLLTILEKKLKIYKSRNLHFVNINHFFPYSKPEGKVNLSFCIP